MSGFSCLYHAPAHWTLSIFAPSLFTSVRLSPHFLLPISHHNWPIWFKFVNLYFCNSVVTCLVSLPTLICLQLRYVNDQITKTAALLYLTLTMLMTKSQRQPHSYIWHSQVILKHKTRWHIQSQSFQFSFPNTMFIFVSELWNRRLEMLYKE